MLICIILLNFSPTLLLNSSIIPQSLGCCNSIFKEIQLQIHFKALHCSKFALNTWSQPNITPVLQNLYPIVIKEHFKICLFTHFIKPSPLLLSSILTFSIPANHFTPSDLLFDMLSVQACNVEELQHQNSFLIRVLLRPFCPFDSFCLMRQCCAFFALPFCVKGLKAEWHVILFRLWAGTTGSNRAGIDICVKVTWWHGKKGVWRFWHWHSSFRDWQK